MLRIGVCGLWLLVMALVPAGAARFSVKAEREGEEAVRRTGPPTSYMPDLDRYRQRVPDSHHVPIPRRQISRDTYMQWIEDSGHLAYAEGDGPEKHGGYGPRHFMPVLAKYVQTGEEKWGRACIRMLKSFDRWMRQEVERTGWHSKFIDEPAYVGLYRKYLSEGGLLDPEAEWFREMVLFMTRTLHVWNSPPTYWRGPMHRAQGEGVMKGLAARWYPDAPRAEKWKEYAETVYQDWWRYKDFPPNDTGYLFGIVHPLFLYAELTGNEEFFTHPGMQRFFDRLLFEISPDGIILPYGAHGGWNSTAATRVYLLELLAAGTGDGRYRFGAHKLMNYLLYQQDRYEKNHILLGPSSTEKIALAYLFADESIDPVRPDGGSRILRRKETLRIRNKEAAEKYLGPLSEEPDKNQICCSLIVTDRTMPAKLVLRSGWDPGDFYALVDLFPRHDPINAPGILGMTRWGAALGMAMNAKGTSLEGRLDVEDLGGTAPLRFNTDPGLADSYYEEVSVEAFEDLDGATFVEVLVEDYAGFPIRYRREFVFIKNRFLITRDVARFEEGFRARVGAVYNTQNVGPQVGRHWANTFFNAPMAQTVPVKNPLYDLLVYFVEKPDRRMSVVNRRAVEGRADAVPARLRYDWEGAAKPGKELLFTQVFYPHAPSKETFRPGSNAPGAGGTVPQEVGANAIHVLRDEVDLTVLRCTFEEGREEWIVCNPERRAVSEEGLSTDARFAYLDVRDGEVRSASVVDAATVELDGTAVFSAAERRNFEK